MPSESFSKISHLGHLQWSDTHHRCDMQVIQEEHLQSPQESYKALIQKDSSL